MDPLVDISLLMVSVFAVALVMKKLGQPVLIAYIVAGIIAGSLSGLPAGYMELMSEIGISFLLFIVGMHLSPSSVKKLGIKVVGVALSQIVFTFALSFVIFSFFFPHPLLPALVATFSSTIIVMKLISDRNELESLHARIVAAILVMQDLVAVVSLLFLSSGSMSISTVAWQTAVVLMISVFLWHLVSRIDRFMARSQELLFLFSIAWLFALATLFMQFGFSPAMGSLVAGVLLSNSTYRFEISSRMKPLRDFFIIMFFIAIGSSLSLPSNPIPVILLLASAMLLKPVVVWLSMRVAGYLPRVSFLSSVYLSQLSEFSIILMALASKLSLTSPSEVSAVAFATIVSMSLTPYAISLAPGIWRISYRHRRKRISRPYDVVLLGCNRIGHIILKSLSGKVLVVDFNPEVVGSIKGADIVYGDAADEDFLEDIRLSEAKMVISTIPDYETNLLVLSKAGKKSLKIVVSYDIEEAMEFYRRGASLVLMPHFLGGEYVASVIEKNGFNISKYLREREKHIKMLEEKKRLGHVHPSR